MFNCFDSLSSLSKNDESEIENCDNNDYFNGKTLNSNAVPYVAPMRWIAQSLQKPLKKELQTGTTMSYCFTGY